MIDNSFNSNLTAQIAHALMQGILLIVALYYRIAVTLLLTNRIYCELDVLTNIIMLSKFYLT